jgi:predicted CxxxxCH...CXXCH cytochrome family protein
MHHRHAFAALAALVLSLSACSRTRSVAESAGGANDQCTRCHGGTENNTGAPPRDLAGQTKSSLPTVGAHSAHVQALHAIADAIACGQCHLDPRQDPSLHRNGKIDVVFGPIATAGNASPTYTPPTFDFQTLGCSAVWCHGAFKGGNAQNPVWNQLDEKQAACGSCHGDPAATPSALPRSNHAQLAAGATNGTCNVCHPATVNADGTILAGGKHVNGSFDTDPAAKHPAGWLVSTSPDFHGLAAAQGLDACNRCHATSGAAKVTTVVCASCHDGLAGGKDWTTTCNTCHGSAQNAAPPQDALGYEGGTGAHQAHVLGTQGLTAPLDCTFCHAKPSNVYDPGHLDGNVSVSGYTGTDATWLKAVKDPTWSTASKTCATSYCHGAFQNGNVANAPDWTKVGQGQAACGTCHGLPPQGTHPSVGNDLTICAGCHAATMTATGTLIPPSQGGKHLDGLIEAGGHDASWMDMTSPNFHAYSADAGIAACTACHGADLSGGFTGVACAQCHDLSLPAGVANWKVNCVMCHGGTDNPTGAPPRATWGQNVPADPSNVRIGAHTAHITGSPIAPPFDCSLCHVKPADALSAGHIDGPTATVTFSGTASKGVTPAPTWDRNAATCSNTYCHGGLKNGNPTNVPVWTQVGTATCGTCHGLPPQGTHPSVSTDLKTCAGCHGATMTTSGTLILPSQGGKHMDGLVEAGGHDASWMDTTSANFHAYSANAGLAGCAACHGATLDGNGNIPACANCHSPSWKMNCTMCHGDNVNLTNAAPPRATWGHSTPNDTTNIRIGAHQSHVLGTHGLMAPLDCTACHTKPADALAAGHVDGLATVSGYTGSDPALLAAVKDPGFDAASATCSTSYCHGATLGGGTITKPKWTTVDGTQAACSTCHGLPPPLPHPTLTDTSLKGCNTCHSSTVDSSGNLVPPSQGGTHMNGKIEGGHDASWMDQTGPGFHAYSANAGLATCTVCHGATLDGAGSAPGCGQCHDLSLPVGVTSWKTNCTMCHGDNVGFTNAAPPRATWGNNVPNDPTNIRIGAHQSHVRATHGLSLPLDCTVCHAKPADALAANHIDAVVSVTGYTGTDPNLLANVKDPSFSTATATCATSYCHGGGVAPKLTDGTLTQPNWTKVDGTQAACKTCHGVPPASVWGHGYHRDCQRCHLDVAWWDQATNTTTLTNPALHVNGVVDVLDGLKQGWIDVSQLPSDCSTCHY